MGVHVYRTYLQAVGVLWFLGSVLCVVVGYSLMVFADLWLAHWIRAEEQQQAASVTASMASAVAAAAAAAAAVLTLPHNTSNATTAIMNGLHSLPPPVMVVVPDLWTRGFYLGVYTSACMVMSLLVRVPLSGGGGGGGGGW